MHALSLRVCICESAHLYHCTYSIIYCFWQIRHTWFVQYQAMHQIMCTARFSLKVLFTEQWQGTPALHLVLSMAGRHTYPSMWVLWITLVSTWKDVRIPLLAGLRSFDLLSNFISIALYVKLSSWDGVELFKCSFFSGLLRDKTMLWSLIECGHGFCRRRINQAFWVLKLLRIARWNRPPSYWRMGAVRHAVQRIAATTDRTGRAINL